MDDSPWITQISKWWALIVLGTVVILFGLFTDNSITLGIGAILAIIGACGESYSHIEAHLGPTELVLKKETVEQAIFSRARKEGVDQEEARDIAQSIAAKIPDGGAPVKVTEAGEAEAVLSETASIIFNYPWSRKPTEEDLARQLAAWAQQVAPDHTEGPDPSNELRAGEG